jgi:hypothetical protein
MSIISSLTIPPAGSLNAVGAPAAERKQAVAGERAVIPLIYGEDRVGARILNVLPAAAGSSTLLVACLWGFACDAVADVQLNDQALPAGASVTSYTGAQTTADSALVTAFAAQSIAYADTLEGYCYSVVALPMRSVEGQLSISARVRGRKVYDPRKDSSVAGGSGTHRVNNPATWEWSDNPALVLADFLRSTLYGCGRTVEPLALQAAADANDALVGSPAEKRRLVGVSFGAPASAAQMADALRAYAGCWLVPGGSGIRLVPDADSAAVATFDHSAGSIAAIGALRLRELGDTPTAVEVLYTDTRTTPWREGSAIASVSGAGTTRPWRLSQVRLPGIQRYSQALREATERLNKLNLQALTTTLDVFDGGIAVEEGDVVTVTHPVGLSAKAMRVTTAEMTDRGRWRLALVEHNAAVYSTGVASPPALAAPAVYAPQGAPANIAGLSATVGQGIITWTWTAPAEQDHEVRARLGGTGWADAAPLWSGRGTALLQRVTATGTYTLRVKAAVPDGAGGWVESATAASVAITVAAGDLVQSEPGAPGQSQVMVDLYQWGSAAAPGNPSGVSTWTWGTAAHSGYTGGNGWGVAIGANPGTAGARLWIARKPLSAAVGTTASTVDWTGGYTVFAAGVNGDQGPTGSTGPAGAAGIKAATPTVYRWDTSTPTISGTGTYTWATASPGVVPSGWSLVPGTGSAGQTLYGASVQLVDAAGNATTAIDWTTASVSARGYAGTNGSAGAQGIAGVSARRAYVLTSATSLGSGTVTSTGSASLPANGSFGASGWASTPSTPAAGQTLYQSDGLYDPASNIVTWSTPYISALKVGNLSALAVNTGDLTVDGALTVASTGVLRSGKTTFGAGTGWLLDNSGGVPRFDIGDGTNFVRWNGSTLSVGGQIIAGANIAGQLSSSQVNPAAGWLNSNVGGVNMLWGSQNGPVSAGPGQYGTSTTYLKNGTDNRFGLQPGDVLTISADLWQDATSLAAGQYAQMFLWAQQSGGGWVVSATPFSAALSPDRKSASVTLPALASDMHAVGVGLYHQGGSLNTAGTVYADRIQVERGSVATQYKPGAEPGATVGAPAGTNVAGTEASALVSTANTAASNASAALSGLSDKLNKSASDILTGTITLNTTGMILAGTTNTGVYMAPGGIVGKKAGNTTFSLDASTGDATFAGQLSAATGTFAGALSAATGTFAGSLSAATGTFSGTLTAQAVNAVDTINIAGNAVTIPMGAVNAGDLNGDGTWATLSIPAAGAPLIVLVGVHGKWASSGIGSGSFKVNVDGVTMATKSFFSSLDGSSMPVTWSSMVLVVGAAGTRTIDLVAATAGDGYLTARAGEVFMLVVGTKR